MVKVRIEKKPEFKIVGRKSWIPGDGSNEEFGNIWRKAHEDGLIDLLHKLRANKRDVFIDHGVFGVSCTEKDPNDRSFYFFVAVECDAYPKEADLEEYVVPACEWAVFENKGAMPDSLVASEMYAFMEWLPNSNYVHANAPEMEVYPPCNPSEGGTLSEFWLPIREK